MSFRPTTTPQPTRVRPSQAVGQRLINCVCVHLVKLYFSILQRKVLTPNDLDSLADLIARIHGFGERYSALGRLFTWTFTRHDLEQRLRDPHLHFAPTSSLHKAA